MQTVPITSSKFEYFCATIEKDMWWHGRSQVKDIHFKVKDDKWLLIIKVTKKGKDWVCFSDGETIDECIDRFFLFMTQKSPTGMKWYPSKF